MNKIMFFAGTILAGVILYQIHTGDLDMMTITNVIAPEERAPSARVVTAPSARISKHIEAQIIRISEKIMPEAREVSILAFGDMMLGRYVATLMQRHGRNYIFEGVKDEEGNFFWDADIVHANLEGPILGTGISGGTSMVFAFHEEIGQFLKESGFDVLSIANNHSLDRGWAGRDNTIRVLEEAGVGWCGHPTEAAPESVYYGTVKVEDSEEPERSIKETLDMGVKDLNAKFAFVCLHDVSHRMNREKALELIEDVSEKVDFLIVSVHWGHEYRHKPDYYLQVEPGRAFVDAGADLVIGHHPHVVQTFEVYNDRFIFYSLGNFVFDQYWSQATQEGLAIGVTLREVRHKGGFANDKSETEDGAYANDKSETRNGAYTNDKYQTKFETVVHLFPMKSELSKSRLMQGKEREEWIERFLNYGDYDDKTKQMVREGVLQLSTL